MKQNELITKRPVAKIGEEISHELGAQFVSSYLEANPADTISYVIGKNIIEKILAQPGCEGVRFFPAYDETGKKTLVYVGVGKDMQALLEYAVVTENGQITSQKAIVADRTQSEESIWQKILKFF